MSRARWLLYLWPGLPQLWWQGAWSALAVAVGFGLLLDAALLATWVYSELLAAGLRPLVWPVFGLVWIGGLAATTWRGLSVAATADLNQREDLFPRTLGEYLKGNWLEAEILCRRLLELNAKDAEALLLLATVLRHAGRAEEARATLVQLRRLDAADHWEQEINDELARLTIADPEIADVSENTSDDQHDHEPSQPTQSATPTDTANHLLTTSDAKSELLDAA